MATMFLLEEMNLFLGDDDPTAGKHLTLQSVKHIVMQEKTVDHHGGGAIAATKLSLNSFEAPELSFKMAGFDPAAASLFGLGTLGRKNYSLYGAYVDKNLETDIEMKVIVSGKMMKIEQDEFKRGDLQGADYMISEIWHYEMWWNTKEKYYYDFPTQAWRVDGNDVRAARRALLRM